MELRHLRYFVAVAEEMNFHRAAKRLHVSQPPLSVTIKQLEEELGTALFLRHKRSISLTTAGEVFLDHARSILAQSAAACHAAQQAAQGITGALSIRFSSSAIMGYLQKAVRAFYERYPRIELHLRQSNNARTLQQLEAGKVDIGIVRLPLTIPEHIHQFGTQYEPYCVVVPDNHRLAQKGTIHITDMAEEPIINFPRFVAPEHYDSMLHIFLEHDITPKLGIDAVEQDAIISLVASGLGVALVPDCMRLSGIPGVQFLTLKGTRQKVGIATLTARPDNILVQNFVSLL